MICLFFDLLKFLCLGYKRGKLNKGGSDKYLIILYIKFLVRRRKIFI